MKQSNSNLIRSSLTQGEELKEKADELLDLIDATVETRNDHKSRIRVFLEFMVDKKITPDTLLFFKRSLEKRRDIKPTTKSKYFTSARVFLRELFKRGLIPTDLTANIKGFKVGKKHKKLGITNGEAQIIIRYLNTLPFAKENARLKVLFYLLALQGLREIEIVRLNCTDVDLIHSIAHIRGKGKDDKEIIHLHPFTLGAIKEYLDLHAIKDGGLVLSYSFNHYHQSISTRGIRFIIGSLLKNLGIRKSTHGFRHFFVTKLIKEFGGNLPRVAKFSRHASLDTLICYNDDIEIEKELPNYYQIFSEFKSA